MVQSTADFRRLKGVGAILSKRLYDAGFDSFAKISQAGEEGLKKVRGISTRSINTILEQARELAGLEHHGESADAEKVQRRVSEVRDRVESVARTTRDRFCGEMTAKCGRKLSSDLVRIENALARMNDFGSKKSKRTSKALVKAEKRVTGLEDASLKQIRKGFKRARKTILKALR